MEARIIVLSTLVVLSSLILPPQQMLGDPGCVPEGTELPEAVVMAARANDLDLVVTLRWHPEADPSIARDLVLRDEDDMVVATRVVFPTPSGFPEEVLVGALSGLGSSGFQFVLRVESLANRGSEPFPFFALRDCPAANRGVCQWRILAGLETAAVVMSEALDTALDTQVGCNLPAQLVAVQAEWPHLKEEVEQLEQQLAHKGEEVGGSPCNFFWQAVVHTSGPTVSHFTQTLSSEGGVADAEVVGFAADAGHCQAAQARRLSVGLTHPSTVTNAGVHGVTLDLRCSAGTLSCRKKCTGTAEVALAYDSCALAEGILGVPYASGMGRGEEDTFLTLNGATVLTSTLEALSYGTLVRNTSDFLHVDAEALPLETLLWTFRELEVAASFGGGVMGLEPEDPNGQAFAFAEVSNEYTLSMVGLAAPGCAMTAHGVGVRLESPDYVQATALADARAGGSIKIEKW